MNQRMLIIGLLLICLGIAGAAWVAFYVSNTLVSDTISTPTSPVTSNNSKAYTKLMRHLVTDFSKTSYASAGERIYLSATDRDGVRLSATYSGAGMPMQGRMSRHIACVNCHGVDGKGGLLFPDGTTKSADIRWSTLVKEGFDQTTFEKAVTKGLDEGDQLLSTLMPRWTMSATDLTDLAAYLKTL